MYDIHSNQNPLTGSISSHIGIGPFKTVDAFLKELLFLSELALLLVEPREVVEANDLKELILESSLNA